MAADDIPDRKRLARRPPRPGYEVGYGKPPDATRFQPGRSGNPKGRPKGSRNKPKLPRLQDERLKTIIMEEAYRTVTVNDGSRQVGIPMAQAVVRSLAVNAAKGHQRSQRLFTHLLAATETSHKRLHDEWLETAIAYKVEWEREIERCRQLGLEEPKPLPHPDHIKIDMRDGSVRVTGPMTREEEAVFDGFRAKKAEFQAEIADLEAWLVNEPDTPYRKQIQDDIEHDRKIVAMISRAIPD